MDFSTLLGVGGVMFVLGFGIHETGVSQIFLNPHGLVIVLGGSFTAMLINTPLRMLLRALRAYLKLFLSQKIPSIDDSITELVKLSEKARSEGGLLTLQDEGKDIAGGFLNRALNVAISTGEANEARRIIEEEIRQIRSRSLDDQNVWRTWGLLAPMFGLLGTLLGIITVLKTMSEPTKVGPAMAVAITSAFYGITLANAVCVPAAGKLRIRMNEEVLAYMVLLEGVLDILDSKPPYLVEMHLNSYAHDRKKKLSTEGAGAPPLEEPAQV
jgi:chemotaxis protein MotA